MGTSPALPFGAGGGLTVSNGTPGPTVRGDRGFNERAEDGDGDEFVGTADGELVCATA